MSSHIPVLIVGAGPTGLMLACELSRYGIEFRIIDKNLSPVSASNATWVQTRTIEILHEIGILDRFLNRGHKCNAVNLYSYGELISKISFDSINSEFKFVLQIPQKETEKILNEYLNELNNKVERSRELITVTHKEKGVHALIGHPDGQTESIDCHWLVACDGANSTVREKSKMSFSSDDLSQKFIVADVEMDATFYPNEINIFLDTGTVFAVFPMGGYQFRLNANLYTPSERYFLNKKELIKMVKERTHDKARVKEISLISPYFIHNKLVKNMRDRSIFFAGDAAHVHSPAGGQGMNLGLQDAYNLAWKLALVVKGKLDPAFLDSYHLERYPIAKKTVNRTKYITKASLIEKFLLVDIRNIGINILNNQFFSSKKFGDRITQLDFEYQKSSIIDYKEAMNPNSPRQGQHAPDVIIDKNTYLHDYLRNPYYNVLLFTGYLIGEKDIKKLKQLQNWLNSDYSDLIKSHVITYSKTDKFDGVIFNETYSIYNRYKIEKPTIYIIRPDKYIAFCSKELNIENIKRYLEKYLFMNDIGMLQ